MSEKLVHQIEEINRALDKCCHLALQQPLPNKHIALMTDASFGAAGYAVLKEDDPTRNSHQSANRMHRLLMVQRPSSPPR